MRWYHLHRRELWFSAFHALALSVLTLVWMNLSWEFGDEVIVARINQIARYEVFNPTNRVVEQFKKDLLLINTSYDKILVPYEDDFGSGTVPVADRKKLAALLETIASGQSQPRLMVVDLIFDNPSPDDSILQSALRKIDKLVVSSRYGDTDEPVAPWPGINFALAQYETTTGTFLKYNLVNDTVKYLPAAMLHETHGVSFRERAGLVKTNEGIWLNSFIVDLPVRKAHLDNGEILVWNLGDALQFEPADVHRLTANKIIIVGDFYRYDMHQTLLGEQPGPLIVANAYLGMLQGIPKIKFIDGVMILLLYFFSTLYALIWRSNRWRLASSPVYGQKLGKFVLKYLTYLVVFSLYSILLYLLTSRHFQLFLFGLYFNLFEYLLDRFAVRFRSPLTKQPALETSHVD